jgi:peptide-methionine (S)-S-oxide reductase
MIPNMASTQVAVFAGGCFWCTEAVFSVLRGVMSVSPGYAGGTVADPTYEQVCTGRTGHAEAVRVTFDPAVIGYDDLLTVFFATHDPTTLNQQGNDIGTQYRSAVFAADEEQAKRARAFIAELDKEHPGGAPIVTTVEALTAFYPAEEHHREYYAKNQGAAYCRMVISPKLEKVKKKFSAMLAEKGGS